MPPGENAISTCPILTATSFRLPDRSDDLENVTGAKRAYHLTVIPVAAVRQHR